MPETPMRSCPYCGVEHEACSTESYLHRLNCNKDDLALIEVWIGRRPAPGYERGLERALAAFERIKNTITFPDLTIRWLPTLTIPRVCAHCNNPIGPHTGVELFCPTAA